MHKGYTPENLESEELNVLNREFLVGVDNSVEVSFHKLCNDVDVVKAVFIWWFEQIFESKNILMFEEFYLIMENLLSSLIYRTILLASTRSSKAFKTYFIHSCTFLIAYFLLDALSIAETTTP